MTTNQLKYFVTAAECLNFTETGKRHHISQTAITQHIQALEETLGVKLFAREKKRVYLTPAGEVFYVEARALLERNRLVQLKVKNAAEGISGSISIGYVKGLENSAIASYLRTFYQKNPSVRFELYRRAHFDLLHDLNHGKLDFIFNFVYERTNLEGISSYHIGKERLYVALPPGHPYAQLSSIRRYDLRSETFLLTKYYDNPSAKDYGSAIPEQFAQSGFIPHTIAKATDAETLLMLVSCGIGITILPETIVLNLRKGTYLAFIPLSGDHEYVNVSALWKEDSENPVTAVFRDCIIGTEKKSS